MCESCHSLVATDIIRLVDALPRPTALLSVTKTFAMQPQVEGEKDKAGFLLPDGEGKSGSSNDGLLISETVIPGFEFLRSRFPELGGAWWGCSARRRRKISRGLFREEWIWERGELLCFY